MSVHTLNIEAKKFSLALSEGFSFLEKKDKTFQNMALFYNQEKGICQVVASDGRASYFRTLKSCLYLDKSYSLPPSLPMRKEYTMCLLISYNNVKEIIDIIGDDPLGYVFIKIDSDNHVHISCDGKSVEFLLPTQPYADADEIFEEAINFVNEAEEYSFRLFPKFCGTMGFTFFRDSISE